MGHTRLGTLPKTQKWEAIVALMSASEEVPPPHFVELVAAQTIEATQAGLRAVGRDAGFQAAFFLLLQVVVAGRAGPEALTNLGLRVDADTTLVELTMEAQRLLDETIGYKRTDISEISQQAFGEALTFIATRETIPLFESGIDALQQTLKTVSTKTGFGQIARRFFAFFLARYLNFYLSRVTATAAGQGKVSQVGDISEFNRLLDLHCHESAKIIEDFSAEWFSKTVFQRAIDRQNTARFLRVALKKLSKELETQKSAG